MKSKNESLTKNSIFYLLYNVLNVIFPFVSGIYVARVLLPDTIGAVDAARNLAQYFVIFSFLGIPTYALREISKIRNDKDGLNKLFSELLIINTISTLVFSLAYSIIIISVPIYRQSFNLYAITGISIALNLINISWLFEGLEKFSFISLRNIVVKIASLLLLFFFVKDDSDYYIYAIITVFGVAGNHFLNILSFNKYVSITFKNLNIKRHLKSIFLLVVVNLAIEIYSLVDITMLNILSDNKSVAFYSYGKKFFDILKTIINTFTIVLVPRIAFSYKNGDLKGFNSLLTKTFKIILILSIPMIIGIMFVSDSTLILIYGEEYINSATILKVLSFLLAITPVGYLLGSRVLLVTGNENKMVIPVIIGAVVNVIGNLLLIQSYGGIGAALASVFSEIAVMSIYLFIGHKYFKLNNCIKSVITILIASLAMISLLALIDYAITNTIIKTILEVLLGTLSYFIILLVFKEEIVFGYFIRIKRRVFKHE